MTSTGKGDLMRRANTPHWIKRTHLFDPDEYECYECGERFSDEYGSCPGCGAPMMGIEDHQDWVDEAEKLDWLMGDD